MEVNVGVGKKHEVDPEVDAMASDFVGEVADYQRHASRYARMRQRVVVMVAQEPEDWPVIQEAARMWKPWRVVILMAPFAAIGLWAVMYWTVLAALNHL